MNGKEYLEYLKYRDSKNKEFNEGLIAITKTKGFKTIMWILGILIVVIAVIDSLTPAQPMVWTWNGVLMFLAVCMGLAWLIHGFGFLLVRR